MFESRITDMNRTMPVGTEAVVAATRQIPNASEPDQESKQAKRSDGINTVSEPEVAVVQSSADVETVVEELNKVMQSQQKDVHFSIDEESQSTVIKFFKTETGELIKQFPPEEILSMMAKIREQVGLLHDSKV